MEDRGGAAGKGGGISESSNQADTAVVQLPGVQVVLGLLAKRTVARVPAASTSACPPVPPGPVQALGQVVALQDVVDPLKDHIVISETDGAVSFGREMKARLDVADAG